MIGCTGTYIAAYIVFHWPMTQSLSPLLSDMWLTLWSPVSMTVSNLRKRWPTNTPLCTWIMYIIMLLYTYICDHYKHISAIHWSCVLPYIHPCGWTTNYSLWRPSPLKAAASSSVYVHACSGRLTNHTGLSRRLLWHIVYMDGQLLLRQWTAVSVNQFHYNIIIINTFLTTVNGAGMTGWLVGWQFCGGIFVSFSKVWKFILCGWLDFKVLTSFYRDQSYLNRDLVAF